MREIPKAFEVYKHFKGKQYQIISIATHSETKEKMVVYQQLYAPFEMYVRPLDMFMSEVDRAKYPQVEQKYRFEKIELKEQAAGVEETKVTQVSENIQTPVEPQTREMIAPVQQALDEEFNIDPGLLEFLEADTYEKKLEILSRLHPVITDAMIDTMAVSLDIEIKDGDIEQRYSEILNCLLTMERFECNRLR